MDLGLRPDDRLVILGSSGWFGVEFTELLKRRECPAQILLVPGPSVGRRVDHKDLVAFRPTVVVNFAFLTRERLDVLGEEEYRRINGELTSRFLSLADSPAVRLALTVSSGAAITDVQHPYGQMKAAEEERSIALTQPSRHVVVLRAYSVSGGYVRRPRSYALSDLILQARQGHVRVRADRPVLRRYVWAQDALEVALRGAALGRVGILETGGELFELGDLATRIVEVVEPLSEITRAQIVNEEPDSYYSDNRSWEEWVSCTNSEPLDIDEQIRQAAMVLLRK